jgi:general secretion pathway protein D
MSAASISLSFADDTKEMISFNFVDVEIPTVIKFISEITGNNFIFDEKIKGKITIIAPTELSIDESFSLFTSILSLKGYTIIPTGHKTYKIIPSSLAKQAGIISVDDKMPVNEGYITKLIPTEHIKAEETIKFLRPIISRDGHISAFGPRNLLLVVDSAVNIEKVMSILKIIDLPSIELEKAKINVFFLENADAENLAKVLKVTLKDLHTAYKTARQGKQKTATGPVPILSITPDTTTNSLVIVASESEYLNIAEVIKTLDKRRKQVFVEAMIIEAQIDKLRDLGTKWRASVHHDDEPVAIGGFGNISSGSMISILSGLAGFSAGGMGQFIDVPITTISSSGTASTQNLTVPGFAALFSLNDFNNAINVLSTPQILTSDNEEAEIVVGENVPFISKRERDAAAANTVLSSIERKDVGITLRITPQITEGEYVKLDIFQEISAVKETPESVFVEVGPTTTKRSTKTSVIVKDSHTVVIGGLMEEREEKEISKMPLLGDIPILGWLFKFQSTSKKKTNLLVFLSPHIVRESPQLSEISEEKHKEFVTKEKFYTSGEILVKFKDNVSADNADKIISEKEASVIKHSEDINVYRIKIRPKQEVEDAVEEFASLEDVLFAEPNYRLKLQQGASIPEKKIITQEAEPPAGTEQNTGIVKQEADEPIKALEQEGTEPVKIREQPQPQKEAEEEKEDFASEDTPYEGEELLIKFKDTISEETAQEIIAHKNASVIKYFKGIHVYHIRLAPGQDVEKSIKDFTSMPDVLYAEPNYRVTTQKEKPVLPKTMADEKSPPVDSDNAPDDPAVPIDTVNTGSPETPGDYDIQPVQTEPDEGRDFFIQVGSWKKFEIAQETMERLKSHYPGTYIVEHNNFSKVRIPGIRNREEGNILLEELKEKYDLNPLLVLETN